jgi:chloramphenicol 3-O phosphotransferase
MKFPTVFLVLAVLVGLYIMIRQYKKGQEKTGTVIILNGPSCAGKSSIIEAFQKKQAQPWLSVGLDSFFVRVLPAKYFMEEIPEYRSVLHCESSIENDKRLFTLIVGHEGQKVIKGMHRAIAAYAQAGNNVIVDYIQYDPAWTADLKQALKGIHVIFVGVTASLETLEQREKSRGRPQVEGHVRSHYNTVHQGMDYMLILDTDKLTPDEAAEKIGALENVTIKRKDTHDKYRNNRRSKKPFSQSL